MKPNGGLQSKEEYYAVYNKQLNVYATREEKSIEVKKLNTNVLLSSLFIRDLNQVTTFKWDSISGKYLAVIFKDGSIRINDMLQNGKLVAFLRTKLNDIDSGIWDRILPSDDSEYTQSMSFNHDILKSLPQLVKYVTDGSNPNMTPFIPQTAIWRQYKKKITDMHILHQHSTDTFVIIINGEYILNLPNNNPNNRICKILSTSKGIYSCFYENGYVKEIDLHNFINDEGKAMTLLENYSLIKDYSKYAKDHVNVVMKKLIIPFLAFIDKLKDPSVHNFDVHEHLMLLFFDGTMSKELSEWLQYTIGEKNLETLQVMINSAYKNTSQILIMCIVPVLERLIILSNQLQSILLSLQLMNQGSIADLTNVMISETKQIIVQCQTLLKTTIEKIKIITHESVTLKTFLIWLEDKVHGVMDEEHSDVLDISADSKYAFQIIQSLDILFGRDVGYDILDSKDYLDKIASCESQLIKLNNLYIEETLINSIEIGPFVPLINQLYEPVSVLLLDVNMVKLGSTSAIVYLVKLLDGDKSKVMLGVIESTNHHIMKDIQVPYEDIDTVKGVRIATSVEETEDGCGFPRNNIRIVTHYDGDIYITRVCNILKEQSSPLKISPTYEDRPINSVAVMKLSFADVAL
ncbi:anaphase-promoting complex subunit 4 [Monosporozyma unispora]|nr:hypothetical protein C6P44_002654 [Kazachstania unispora]